MDNPYSDALRKTCNPAEITKLSRLIFKEGHLDMIDDLIIAILPLAHMVYYKYIRYLDDREHAKEDLISEAVIRVYQDVSFRWDKYIYIDAYYEYFSTILKNGMIGLVHQYHDFYAVDDVDPETIRADDPADDVFEEIEVSLLKESLRREICNTSERLLKCRSVNSNLLLKILKAKYVDKSGLTSLKSRVRVLGVSPDLFRFYCEHVDYVYKLAYNYHYALLGGKGKMISRISGVIDRFEDVTYRMLSVNYYDSIIPEIYAEFGADIAKKFVRTFSGRTVQVPNYKDFCDDLLGGVVMALSNGDKSKLPQISDDYNIPYRTLARVYNKAMKGEGESKE